MRPPSAAVRCLAVALVVVSLALAGCAPATHPADPRPAATGSGPPAEVSGLDLVFLHAMTAHQERTLAILRVAPERIRQPSLRTLVAAVEATEADEVARAREWIRAADPDPGGHRHEHPEPTGDADPVARLRGTPASAYDAALVAVLASQQRQAAELARAHLALAVSPVVRDLARRIDESRTAQLRLLAALPVARPTP
ncbi:DUF305 domain-containing protein [Micromonospora rifamycinica]|uniref:DUF305 domain-containing protein n=1 Tax=Micromonospora rifamycinica TaxID=291594 RepID=UPI0033E0F2F6